MGNGDGWAGELGILDWLPLPVFLSSHLLGDGEKYKIEHFHLPQKLLSNF
jgi:hypothetical protein